MEDRWSETNSQTFLDRGRVFTALGGSSTHPFGARRVTVRL